MNGPLMDARSINTRTFIAAVQKRPAIWDQTCEDYNNKDQKFDDWQSLTLMFIPKDENFTPVEVKSFTNTLQRRWKNLRDCYTRELLRIMKLKASGNVDRKRGYIYFKHLSFLKKVVKPTKRSNQQISPSELEMLKSVVDPEENARHSEDPLEEIDMESDTKTFQEDFQESSNNYNSIIGGVSEDATSTANFSNEVRNISNGYGRKSKSKSSESRQTHSQNCDRLFLLSLLEDLQRVSEERKLDVKIELMGVLKRAVTTNGMTKTSTKRSDEPPPLHYIHRVSIKDEAESELFEDIEEHSLDSIRDPTTPELLEEDNV